MKTLVAGIGSEILSDDGVGLHAIRRLPGHVDAVEMGTAGMSLLDRLTGYQRLIIVDAIVTGSEPGTLFELSGEEIARSVHLGAGHEADFPTTLAMGARLLGKDMPSQVVVLAVEAADLVTFSEQLTPQVEAALPAVLRRIDELLKN